MRKKLIGIAVMAAIAVTAGWNFSQSKNEVAMSDLALANVDALANDEEESEYDKKIWERYYREDGGYNCTKNGSESC